MRGGGKGRDGAVVAETTARPARVPRRGEAADEAVVKRLREIRAQGRALDKQVDRLLKRLG